MLHDDPPPANGGPPRLLPRHLDDLRKSGLTDETITACGFYSETDPAAVARLLNRKSADPLVPCLVIPFTTADGSAAGYAQVKPDTPYVRVLGKKPAKYVSPSRIGFRAYLPPGTRPKLSDPTVPLILTEGPKKAAAADQHGFACVALVGVEAWAVKRPKGKDGRPRGRRVLIPDLAALPWPERTVYVIYDSDAATKKEVRRAEKALARAVRGQGAVAACDVGEASRSACCTGAFRRLDRWAAGGAC